MSTTMVPNTQAEAVANGAQLLDDRHPGWWRLIDLPTLELEECDKCVCGQLARAYGIVTTTYAIDQYAIDQYTSMLSTLGLTWMDTDRLYGFNILFGHGDYLDAEDQKEYWEELDHEWHKVITARLEADALALRGAPIERTQQEARCPVVT